MDRHTYIAETINRYPVTWTRGEGSRLFDDSGREYIDFFTGHAVMALGYNHPPLQEAMCKQMQTLIHTGNLYHLEQQEKLAEALCRISFADSVLFANSGTEIVDLSFKLARRHKLLINPESKPLILSMESSFHGRTFGALTATGQEKYKRDMGPMLPGIRHIPFNDSTALKEADAPNLAAILLEPIQGDGGIIPIDPEFLLTARALCDKNRALLIFDEIQTGLGRTGTVFGYEQLPVLPDVLLLGKPLGGGLPISALLTIDTIAETLAHGDHGSTFGGNPVAAAAGLVLLEELQQPDFMEAVCKKRQLLVHELRKIRDRQPELVRDIRGPGLMIGVELTCDARRVTERALEEGLVINNPVGNVLRIIPALNIPDEDIVHGCAILDSVLKEF